MPLLSGLVWAQEREWFIGIILRFTSLLAKIDDEFGPFEDMRVLWRVVPTRRCFILVTVYTLGFLPWHELCKWLILFIWFQFILWETLGGMLWLIGQNNFLVDRFVVLGHLQLGFSFTFLRGKEIFDLLKCISVFFSREPTCFRKHPVTRMIILIFD